MVKAKKGFNIPGVIGSFFLIFLVVFLVLPWLSKTFAATIGTTDSQILKSHIRECVSSKTILDIDEDVEGGDDWPDHCDICLGGGIIDSDRDGMPDDCDENPDDPAKFDCKDNIRRKDYKDRFYCCIEALEYAISETRNVECEESKGGLFN